MRSCYDLGGSMSLAGHHAVFDAYDGPKHLVTQLAELERMQGAWLAAAATARVRTGAGATTLAR